MIDRILTQPEANIAEPMRSLGILKRTSFILKYATVCLQGRFLKIKQIYKTYAVANSHPSMNACAYINLALFYKIL